MTITQFTQRLIIACAVVGVWIIYQSSPVTPEPVTLESICKAHPTLDECPNKQILKGDAL